MAFQVEFKSQILQYKVFEGSVSSPSSVLITDPRVSMRAVVCILSTHSFGQVIRWKNTETTEGTYGLYVAIWQQQTLLAAANGYLWCSGRQIRDNDPVELAASAIGFLVQIQIDKFSFITVFLNLLLSLIEPINKQLQADALDVPAVTRMINAVRDEIWKMRSDVMFKQLTDDSGIQLKDDSLAPMKMQFNIETVMWQSANVDLQHGLLNTLLINPDIDMQLTQT